jgi:hypothetical protein
VFVDRSDEPERGDIQTLQLAEKTQPRLTEESYHAAASLTRESDAMMIKMVRFDHSIANFYYRCNPR